MRRLLILLGAVLSTSAVRADVSPITGWMVHNGTAVAGGSASVPTFTPGDNITLMAPFTDAVLANDGDFVEATTTLSIDGRTGTNTGVNGLNTQLRVGLFDDNANSTLTAGDSPNLGFTLEYTNLASGGLMREQTSATQTSPFTSPGTQLGTAPQDSGGDSIRGANPGPIIFDIRLTRDAGKLDLTGSISATDPVSGGAYLANFSSLGFSDATFPANGTFTFNRIGLFLGGNADSPVATLSNSVLTTPSVPEPATFGLAGMAVCGILAKRRTRRGK